MFVYFINDLHIDKHLPQLKAGAKSSAAIHRWMDEYFLPADVLCIAGDIADSSLFFIDFLAACRGRYKYVFYVYGNHDIGVYKSEHKSVSDKLDAIEHWLGNFKRLTTSTHDCKTKFFKLDGNEIVGVNGLKFVGAMGSSDWSYGRLLGSNNDYFIESWRKGPDGKAWKKWWSDNPLEIVEDEKKRLIKPLDNEACDPRVVVTHFAPLGVPVPEKFKNNLKTGYFYWDCSEIINKLPKGTIWHFGHTHAKLRFEKDGILYLNNPVGYPGENVNLLGEFKKEDFLIKL